MGEASMSSQQRAAAPISPGSPTRPSLIATTKSTVDAVVAAGTVLYVLGFLSWACYAWTHDFGISPSPQAQYFVAGLVPGLLLAMFIGGLRVIGWLRERLRRAPTDAEVRAATRVAGVGMALFFGGGALGLILKRTAVGHSSFVEVLQYSGMIVMFGSFFFSPGALERRFARGAAWLSTIYAPLLVLAGFILYVDRLFPDLPAEFGGPKAVCVELDLEAKGLSPTTMRAYLGGASPATEGTFRSQPVWLISAPGNFLLVLDGHQNPPSRSNRFERKDYLRLRESSVSAAFSSDACTGK
jgi:hypothetical protein